MQNFATSQITNKIFTKKFHSGAMAKNAILICFWLKLTMLRLNFAVSSKQITCPASHFSAEWLVIEPVNFQQQGDSPTTPPIDPLSKATSTRFLSYMTYKTRRKRDTGGLAITHVHACIVSTG